MSIKTSKTIHKVTLLFLFGLGLGLSGKLYSAQQNNLKSSLNEDTSPSQTSIAWISLGELTAYPTFDCKKLRVYINAKDRRMLALLDLVAQEDRAICRRLKHPETERHLAPNRKMITFFTTISPSGALHDEHLPQAQILQEAYGATCKGTWVCQNCGAGNEQTDERCTCCKRSPFWPPIRR